MKKKQTDHLIEQVNAMPVDDIFDNAFDIKNAAIKNLCIIGGVTVVALIIALTKHIFIAATFLAAFMFARPFYFKNAHIVIRTIEVRTDKIVGETNKGLVIGGVAMLGFAIIAIIYDYICSLIFPAYAVLPTLLMVELALGMLAKPVSADIINIITANKISEYYYERTDNDVSKPVKNIYGKGIRQYLAIGRKVLIVTILLLALALMIAIGSYHLRSSKLEAMFDPNESYSANIGDEAEIRIPIPSNILDDLSYGSFKRYSSQYDANYNYTTVTNGFEMVYDISVFYEFDKNTTPNWIVKKYKYNFGELGTVDHSGVWTGEGTDDHAPTIFKDECTFTLTFETLTDTYAKGSFLIVGTDGTEIYRTEFEGAVEKTNNKLVATVLLSNPRHTFSGLDDNLKITIDPLEDKVTLGMDYMSANLKLSKTP